MSDEVLQIDADRLKQALKEDPDFYPLSTDAHELDTDWDALCDHTLAELAEVPVETKPATEQQLFAAQWSFYEQRGTGDPVATMFHVMVPYARSLILKQKKNSRFIEKETLLSMAQEVSLRVCSQFLRRPGFLIKASFAGYIKWKILEVTGEADDFERAEQIDPLTKRRKKIPLLSLNMLTDSARQSETTIEDLQERLGFTALGGAQPPTSIETPDLREEQLLKGLNRIIDAFIDYINTRTESDMHAYRDELYSLTALHVLLSAGSVSYTTYRGYCPTVRLGLLLDAAVGEIAEFLRESLQESTT